MERLFNDIQKRIAENMGDALSLIDEDYGQLEALLNEEDRYPVTFPCVLISMPEVQWKDLKARVQHGEMSRTIRLAFDCYDDTHYGSTQEHHATQRMAMAERLNGCLNGIRFEGCATIMLRRMSRNFSLPGGIKVYETEYASTVYGTTAEQETCVPDRPPQKPKIRITDVSGLPADG